MNAVLRGGVSSNRIRGAFARVPFSWGALAAIVLGVVVAKWAWVLLGPREAAVAAPAGHDATAEAEGLFGVAASGDGVQSVAIPNAKLVGVFTGRHGFAILELDGNKQVGVALGAEVVRGVKLSEIGADHVVLEGGGGRQRVDLEKKAAAAAGTAAAPPAPGGGAGVPGPMPNGVPNGMTLPAALAGGALRR